MTYTPEMISFLRENALEHYTETITDLFNKKFNAKCSTDILRAAIRFHNIAYKKHIITRERKQVGDEYSDKKGTYIKISDDEEKGRSSMQRRGTWKKKQVFLWENAHGSIPKGYRVIFLDKNKSNFELDNLELVSHNEFLLLNKFGLYSTDKEVTKTGLAVVRYRQATLRAMAKGMSEEERKTALTKIYKETYRRKKENAI